MKKVCFSVLLIANIFSLQCAQQQRSRQQNYTLSEYADSNVIPVYTNNIFSPNPFIVPMHIEANQPGWQQLDDIMNMTYKSDQHTIIPLYPTIQNSPLVKPIIKPLISPEEKIKNVFMEQVYKNACTYINYQHCTDKPDKKIVRNNLIFLILSMYEAKERAITEDVMAKFAYKSYTSFDCNNTSSYIPLLFSLLKRYNITVQETNETLPSIIGDDYDKELINSFNNANENIFYNQSDMIQKQLNITPNSRHATRHSRPAYAQLAKNLKTLFTSTSGHSLNHLTVYLHNNSKILLEGYSDGSYTNLLNDFYHKAFCLLINNGTTDDIVNLCRMIEKAKKMKAITEETDLGRAVLNFEPTLSFENISHWMNIKYASIDSKNRVSCFCKLVEDYNKEDPNKERPTGRQLFCYKAQKAYKFGLPDSFDNSLLNEQYYAFIAFRKFRKKVIALMTSKDQIVQRCVNQQYYSK